MEVVIGVVVGCCAVYLLTNCCSYRVNNHVTFSSNNNTGQNVIIGNHIVSNYTSVPAAKLKLVAYDKNDKILQSAALPTGTTLSVQITTSENIDSVRVSQGKLEITSCGGIGKVRNSQGAIHIGKSGDIKEVRTSQGSIHIDSCNTVGSTKTSQGNIKVHERSPARPQS